MTKLKRLFVMAAFMLLSVGAFAQSNNWQDVMKIFPTARHVALKLVLTGRYDSRGEIVDKKLLIGDEAYVLISETSGDGVLVVPMDGGTPFVCNFNGNVATAENGWWIKLLGVEANKESSYRHVVMTKDSNNVFRIFELKAIFEELFR